MQLTWGGETVAEEKSFESMKAAVDAGATAWSSATFYGNPPNPHANLQLLNRFFTKYPEYKDKVTLIVKGGNDKPDLSHFSGKLEFLREDVRKAQEALGDKKIDVYSMARTADDVEIEEAFASMKTLVEEGVIGAVAASEMNAESLERAHKIVPIACIEIEVSLWCLEPSTKAVLEWSKANSVPVLAYSPLGRGFITRKYKSPEDIPEGSFQRHVPRFQGEAFYENLKLVDELDKLAEKKGVTTGQLALAWVVGLGPYNIPIPGSSNVERVKQNVSAANITLSEAELSNINEILDKFEVKGTRYPAQAMGHLMR